jgi:uncharacterized coiled-coil protein SlyX
MDTSDERFAAIEIKLAYLEHTVSELDNVLRTLSSDMDVLKAEIIRLRDKDPAPPPTSDKPPHY